MRTDYVHGYEDSESRRLRDQALTLTELLHGDTRYPAGASVLEAGCGVGAQTVTLPDGSSAKFPIDGFARYCLMNGVDELGFLLSQEAAISKFESRG